MGYTRIVQYGDITELYQYEKNRRNNEPTGLSTGTKALLKTLERQTGIKPRPKRRATGTLQKLRYYRSNRSIRRCRVNFFRLCHHNNVQASSIHFLTLTFSYDLTYKQATRHIARFMERVRKNNIEETVSYISVPELTKKGRFHFHLLVYGLSTRMAGKKYKNAKYTTERETRNLQRLFERGYLDICPATYTTEGIAGYMAKYMAKALGDDRYETVRGYNCSRNIKKITTSGSNTLDIFLPVIIHDHVDKVEKKEYNVPYLGKCLRTKIIKKQ